MHVSHVVSGEMDVTSENGQLEAKRKRYRIVKILSNIFSHTHHSVGVHALPVGEKEVKSTGTLSSPHASEVF